MGFGDAVGPFVGLAKNEFLFGRYVPFEEVQERIDGVTSGAIQKWFEDVYQESQVALMLLGPVEQDSLESADDALDG